MTTPLIEARNVVRNYYSRRGVFGQPVQVRAVDGVSLKIARGETLGLVGESGCGKSTTARLLLGMEPADEGAVLFEGQPLPSADSADWRSLRRRMQMVFQDPLGALDRRLPAGKQITEPLDIHRIGTPAERQARLATLLEAVGLRPDFAARFPHELSGGQRQRAVLARALATDPELLICDEPISALDVSIQAQVMNLLTDIQAELGLGILFVSHDLRAVRQVSHRVAVMYLGRIVEEGPPDAVLHDPRHPYTQALVSAIPHPGKTTGRTILEGDPPNPADRPSGCAFHPRCPVATSFCAETSPNLTGAGQGRAVACHVAQGTVAAGSGLSARKVA